MFVNADDNQSATIADISLNVTDGVHNTVKDDPDGSYLLLGCKNIKGGSLNIGSSERHINKETFDKLRKRTQLAKGDILISSVGTIGEILMLNTEPTQTPYEQLKIAKKPILLSSLKARSVIMTGAGFVCSRSSNISLHKPCKRS